MKWGWLVQGEAAKRWVEKKTAIDESIDESYAITEMGDIHDRRGVHLMPLVSGMV